MNTSPGCCTHCAARWLWLSEWTVAHGSIQLEMIHVNISTINDKYHTSSPIQNNCGIHKMAKNHSLILTIVIPLNDTTVL